MSFLSRKCAKKLSCGRRIHEITFWKLCPAVNYGTERYTFSHKSVALSAVVRCKFSVYFFGKILHTPGFCLQKHVWTQKRQLFSKIQNLWSFCWKHTEQYRWKLIQNMRIHELCAVMKGLTIFHSSYLFTFTLLRTREDKLFRVPKVPDI